MPAADAGQRAVTPDLERRVEAARRDLDAQVRDVVAWHFSPETGCPFWLAFASRLDFDPRREIRSFADLRRLPPFEDDWLRGGPVRRWIPRGLAGRPAYVFETGGTTGAPKCRVNIEDFQTDYRQFSDTLPEAGFPLGGDWLMLGPTGPRRLRLAIEHLAQHRGGICFLVDLDPRWVNRLLRDGRLRELEEYKEHCVAQALTLLRVHEGIRCLFTTPRLLEALARRIDLGRAGIRGILCGGTEMTAQFHRFAREELAPGVEFVPTYGNTMMGLACARPFDPAAGYDITYHAPQPRAVIELADPADPDRSVEYGETGRVRLTTLTREFFLPRLLERDQGERVGPCERYPWDGARNVALYEPLRETVTVGVY